MLRSWKLKKHKKSGQDPTAEAQWDGEQGNLSTPGMTLKESTKIKTCMGLAFVKTLMKNYQRKQSKTFGITANTGKG